EPSTASRVAATVRAWVKVMPSSLYGSPAGLSAENCRPRFSTARAPALYSPCPEGPEPRAAPVPTSRNRPTVWSTIESKVRRGERLSPEEGVYLVAEAPLLELGSLAHQ